MGLNRDDFKATTIEVLGKRVAYLCSNPGCRRPTIGPNAQIDKATSIGIAAHITAASIGGPRYDVSLTKLERIHIDNGIWLCSNCAALIDKDEAHFTTDVLRKWKSDAEEESWRKLYGKMETVVQPSGRPHIEADLILTTRGRRNRGYSEKNPIVIENGSRVMIMPNNPIIHWGIFWSFNFVVFNNSSFPAFNLSIESVGDEHFNQLDSLNGINNLPPLMNVSLKARYEQFVEGDYLTAEEIQKQKMP